MSDGLRDAFGYLIANKDRDPWGDDDITEIIDDLNEPTKNPYPWLDLAMWKPKRYDCTCGAEKTYGKNTTHSDWCDKVRV